MKKIDFMMIVLNGEPFLSYNLKSIYPWANKIWIIEGADGRTKDHVNPEFFTKNGHSFDNTVEIIKSHPDPEHKITLIQKDGFWQDKDEMISQINDLIKSDYVFEVDVDEFYKDEDYEKLFKIIEEYPQVTGFGIPWRNFWHNFHTIYGLETKDTFKVEWGWWGWRLFKWIPGVSKWLTHRPPTVSLDNGQNSMSLAWGPAHLVPYDVWTYHYSDLIPQQNLIKSQYYEIPQWYENIFMRWLKDPKTVEDYGIYPLGGSGKTIQYLGTHPKVIYDLAKKLNMEI